jgi:hypothetical protein
VIEDRWEETSSWTAHWKGIEHLMGILCTLSYYRKRRRKRGRKGMRIARRRATHRLLSQPKVKKLPKIVMTVGGRIT